MINPIIVDYTFEEKESKDFINFLKELYQENKYSKYYINSIKKLKSIANPSFKNINIKSFIAYHENKVIGHISAIIDSRLSSKKNIGILGFYECVDDLRVSKLLIDRAIEFLKNQGCTIIRGPIDLTIWHIYRFVIEQNDSFILEPMTKKYYLNQFKKEGFSIAAEYVSGERSDFETILPYTKPAYDSLQNEGFKITKINRDNFDKEIKSIYNVAKKTFRDSWSYVEISEEEFMYIYKDFKENLENFIMEIVYNTNNEPIGFCSSIIDPIKNKTMILKTIAVLPEYQNKKIGAALLYSQHKEAFEKGFYNEIYALIRAGNVVTKMPYQGITIIRNYVALEKSI